MKFFVDSCIYLNLWKQEKMFWQGALSFFEEAETKKVRIYFSGFILKELKHIIGEKEFTRKRELFSQELFEKIRLTEEDLDEARFIEIENNFSLSFFDCIHLVSSIKTDSALITRDRLLLRAARRKGVSASTPEKAFTENSHHQDQ